VYRTRPSHRPANRRNPKKYQKHSINLKNNVRYFIFFTLHDNDSFEKYGNASCRPTVEGLKMKLTQNFNKPIDFKLKKMNNTCSRPRRIHRRNPLCHRSADPCGNIQQPNTARIRFFDRNWLQYFQ
jgi:hypothetical protein